MNDSFTRPADTMPYPDHIIEIEYKILEHNWLITGIKAHEKFEEKLNEHARDGWDFLSAVAMPPACLIYTLIRKRWKDTKENGNYSSN